MMPSQGADRKSTRAHIALQPSIWYPWVEALLRGRQARFKRQAKEVTGVEQLLYSVREAAGIVGVGKSKMWELVARGEIESIKVDALRKIPADALTAYVERLRAEQAVPA